MQAKIKVVGVGGAGGNALNTMVEERVHGVEFIAMNTDAQDLERSRADVRVQIGAQITKGLGAGANPEIGRRAAEEDREAIKDALAGADMVFIAAGLGGGTGTGAAPIVAEIARELDILTVAVVTKPFGFEGAKRQRNAEEGLQALSGYADTMIVIPNDKLLKLGGGVKVLDMFRRADRVILDAVRGIAEMITRSGYINVDFADVRAVMLENRGMAVMGCGVASGEGRAAEAAELAVSSPLVEDVDLRGARGVLVNISASQETFTIDELQEVMSVVGRIADPEQANVIQGMVFDDALGDEMRVTIVAAGFGDKRQKVLGASGKLGVLPGRKPERWAGGKGAHPAEQVPLNLEEQELEIPTFLRRQAD
ncbi:MAG: cell division protein FtsZ [Zetaproteobacteria bacterium]|nr:MAG: cell division protein FtsZ [Zetaproteobacteria bacterium]